MCMTSKMWPMNSKSWCRPFTPLMTSRWGVVHWVRSLRLHFIVPLFGFDTSLKHHEYASRLRCGSSVSCGHGCDCGSVYKCWWVHPSFWNFRLHVLAVNLDLPCRYGVFILISNVWIWIPCAIEFRPEVGHSWNLAISVSARFWENNIGRAFKNCVDDPMTCFSSSPCCADMLLFSAISRVRRPSVVDALRRHFPAAMDRSIFLDVVSFENFDLSFRGSRNSAVTRSFHMLPHANRNRDSILIS